MNSGLVQSLNYTIDAQYVKRQSVSDHKTQELRCERKELSAKLSCDLLISSMPLKDLVADLNAVPESIRTIADGLPYRDYVTLGVLVDRLKLRNETDIPTLGNLIPDDWIYVQDRSVKLGRIQIYNNWPHYMVHDPEHTVWPRLEFFCQKGDALWTMDEGAFREFAVKEMQRLGLIEDEKAVLDCHREQVKKAYPRLL